ncbi:MAG: AAA family ATPase [Bacteroidales bacterium]|nr:AAA family ATPase [Bacteroidales bacterium]
MNSNASNIINQLPTAADYAPVHEFLPEDQWMDVEIEGSLLNLDDELETPEYTINLNGARMGPVTGVQTIAGQSGHGKTQLMTLLMSAYIGAQIDGIRCIWERKDPRALYVDTEMEKGNTQLVVARIARICNTEITALKSRLTVMRLRDEENHANIWRKILKATWQLKPDVLFLDGMIDIIGDFNDNKEANLIIRKVMKLADHYEIPIWAVMHQNPGTTKMAGHQGSFLERKSTAVISPVKVCDDEKNGIYHFDIKNGKQRGEDIRPLSFHMERFTLPNGDTNAYPVIGKDANGEPTKQDTYRQLEAVMAGLTLSTRDMRQKVMDAMRLNQEQAMEYINQAVEDGILNCDEEWTKDGSKLKSRHYTFNSGCPF